MINGYPLCSVKKCIETACFCAQGLILSTSPEGCPLRNLLRSSRLPPVLALLWHCYLELSFRYAWPGTLLSWPPITVEKVLSVILYTRVSLQTHLVEVRSEISMTAQKLYYVESDLIMLSLVTQPNVFDHYRSSASPHPNLVGSLHGCRSQEMPCDSEELAKHRSLKHRSVTSYAVSYTHLDVYKRQIFAYLLVYSVP